MFMNGVWIGMTAIIYEACKKQGIVENPVGHEIGSARVLRGGRWSSYAQFCRSATRDYANPGYSSGITGFRLVFVP
jgi:formylglycine-generating enzyme required for sulfatase activity